MKDILFKHEDKFIECDIDGTKLTYTFSDMPTHHTVVVLRDLHLYEELKKEINEIYDLFVDKHDSFFCVSDFIQSVDCHNKYFVDDKSYSYCDIRSRHEMKEYLDEAFDKVWLMRNCHISDKQPVHEASRQGMNRILASYNDIPKDGYSDWECGYWNGIMGALRWVLGDEKDFLDT